MQDRRQRRALVEAHGRARRRCIRRPAASRPAPAPPACGRAAARKARALGARLAVDADRLDIGVAGEQQMRADRFEEARRRPGAGSAAPADRAADARSSSARALVEHEGQPRRSLSAISRTARCTMALRDVALARQRGIVARRPARAPAAFERDQPRGARGFSLRRAEQDLRRSNMVQLSWYPAVVSRSNVGITFTLPQSCGRHMRSACAQFSG